MANTYSVTTRTGDRGTTRLFSGEEISKDSLRTEAYGDIDELVSILGVVRSMTLNPDVKQRVLEIQHRLFDAAAELATSLGQVHLLKRRIDEAVLAAFERERDELESRIVMPGDFIMPGGTTAGAHLDVARAVSRRCERKAVRLVENGFVQNQHLIIWLNRLSDYLWLLARLEEGPATQERKQTRESKR